MIDIETERALAATAHGVDLHCEDAATTRPRLRSVLGLGLHLDDEPIEAAPAGTVVVLADDTPDTEPAPRVGGG